MTLPIESTKLSSGVYDQVVHAQLEANLDGHPELQAHLRKIDSAEEPQRYAQFLWKLLEQSFKRIPDAERATLVNRLIDVLASAKSLDILQAQKLPEGEDASVKILEALIDTRAGDTQLPRPASPLNASALFTGSAGDPTLESELRQEMYSADQVNFLVSFIKMSGYRLLEPAFETLARRGIPVRILTTSYMGASDPHAIERLSKFSNVKVRVSLDSERTRLHAKAYHFHRASGFSTAYIGSANLSNPAMTSGREWTVKVTAQDQPDLMQRCRSEFETYWNSEEFIAYEGETIERFRQSVISARQPEDQHSLFIPDISPHPYQQRILDTLQNERHAHNSHRNLVVAATGTGKTVIAAFDYARFCATQTPRPRLLFVAHRETILKQALQCFRTVLRDPNFGELLSGNYNPDSSHYLFATIQSIKSRKLFDTLGVDFYNFVILDEAHHGTAASYRYLIDTVEPAVLLGLTATPERMDGGSILPDFNQRFAAEIRLPEALEAKLLCPFHYFGVTDPVDLTDDGFWKNGKYDHKALEAVYSGDDIRAKQRVDALLGALDRYIGPLQNTRGLGFCVTKKHAHYMATCMNERGIPSAALVDTTSGRDRLTLLADLRDGKLTFLFTVDLLSEGYDLPTINLVAFLRPTESLTVFLQQLGRGLRLDKRSGKECLTVLDLVGQSHRKYRIARKFSALLPKRRYRMDDEVESDFPHLPPGCSILLERVAKEEVLKNIKDSLRNLQTLVTESYLDWKRKHNEPPTLGQFIESADIEPVSLLKKKTWSEWKALAEQEPFEQSINITAHRNALARIALRNSPSQMQQILHVAEDDAPNSYQSNFSKERDQASVLSIVYGNRWKKLGFENFEAAVQQLHTEPSFRDDLREIAEWRVDRAPPVTANDTIPLDLHAAYGTEEVVTALGLSNWTQNVAPGKGVFHDPENKRYIHLFTFQKSERDFIPSTQYHDDLISRKLLQWESQNGASQSSPTGQNYLNFPDNGYQILFFAKLTKKHESKETAPFIYLGEAKRRLSAEGNSPIKLLWELEHPVPAELFEAVKLGG
ncbi:MAG TPA: NgoFVII family restriction endonuclease [Opitutae bacterium]|nr:NgoFVII family restriction endonuclease [Opitutae bacterium]